MARKRENLLPRNLQLGESVYQVVKTALDEHKDHSISTLNAFSIKGTKITRIEFDPDKEGNILINGKISIPGDGQMIRGEVGEVIVDHDEAKMLIVSLIKAELHKAEKILETARQEVAGVKSNLAIYDNDKPLQIEDVVVNISAEKLDDQE